MKLQLDFAYKFPRLSDRNVLSLATKTS